MGGGLRAVLFDMDGTLVDSEKLWDVSLAALYDRLGGVITDELRTALVGSAAENTIRTIFADIGLEPDPAKMAEADQFLHEHTGQLFATRGLPWCDGARELLESLVREEVPIALVTNTQRALTEQALESIGRHYFTVTVCGDEVPNGKPAPDPYLRAAELLDLDPAHCLAVEDSVTGSLAAELAGCPVLVVPNDVVVPPTPRRRHIDSLRDVAVDDLRAYHAEIDAASGKRTA